jgi:ubiquinone/menaquinone biosynthesis C-methylase UbiE
VELETESCMTQLMEYIDLPPQQGTPAPHGSRKFHGEIATGYDAKREQDPKWQIEQRVIEEMLSDLPPGTTVLDLPVGTGRFIPFYGKQGLFLLGVDRSQDMLAEAAKKIEAAKVSGELHVGDILDTKLRDKVVDVTVNCRITRWIMGDHGPQGIIRMLEEMQRVTRQRIILTARVRDHKFAVTHELILSALKGWKINKDIAGVDLNYRIIELRPE